MVEVRRVEKRDAVEVGRLHAQVWRETYVGILSDRWIAKVSDRERVRRWRTLVRGKGPATQWVAIVDGVIAGFAASGPARGANPIRDFELWSIHVLAKYARQGVGRALTDVAIGDRPASVWVVAANHPAQRFYESLGFVADGATSTIDYWENVPELRMSR